MPFSLVNGLASVGSTARRFVRLDLPDSLKISKERDVRFAWQPEHAIPAAKFSSTTWAAKHRSVPGA